MSPRLSLLASLLLYLTALPRGSHCVLNLMSCALMTSELWTTAFCHLISVSVWMSNTHPRLNVTKSGDGFPPMSLS